MSSFTTFSDAFSTHSSNRNGRDRDPDRVDIGLDLNRDLDRPEPSRPHRSRGGGSGSQQGMRDMDQNPGQFDRDHKSLLKERDQALEDLCNVETAFSDLHKRYERAKMTMENFKENEDLLKDRDAVLLKKLQEREQQVAKLKEEATKKLEMMYTDYEKKAQIAEAENARLRAQVRKSEMKISTLESDLEQKTKENEQLHVLCDDLIHGGGGSGGGENGGGDSG